MNKTLTIDIHQDPTKHIEQFLQNWLQFGAYEQISELEFELIGRTGKTSKLSMTQYKITISGNIPSESFMLIDVLSKACESDKIIEGEVIGRNQTRNQTNQPNFENLFGSQAGASGFKMPIGMSSMINISGMSKFKLILLLILAIPLLLIIIPVVIVFSIIKIIMNIFITKF